MQNLDFYPNLEAVEMGRFADCEDDQLLVIELVVPLAAIVPAPVHQARLALPVVHKGSVTSTVPATIYLQLRANNTALGAAWRTTATLTAAPASRPALY